MIQGPRRRRIVVTPSAGAGSSANHGETAGPGGPDGPNGSSDQWVRDLKASLHEGDVSSAAIKSKMLTRMGTPSSAERPGAAGAWPPTAVPGRRHARRRAAAPATARRAGGSASTRPGQSRRRRPRLVSVGALAAVASVIGATAVIATVAHDNQPITVNAPTGMPAELMGTTPSPATPTPVPTSAASVESAPATPPSVTDEPPDTAPVTAPASSRPSNGGSLDRGDNGSERPAGQSGQVSQKYAARGADADTLPREAQLVLPGRGVADWVVFGPGDGGVTSRAAISFPLIDARRLAGVGYARDGYDTRVSWSGGTPPRSHGTRVDDRLSIPNGRSAALTVYRGPYTGTLLVYLGGSTRLSVRVSAAGMLNSDYTLRLSGSNPFGVITIDLGDLPDWTPATVTVTGTSGDRSSLSLAAAVLR
ncbi:MULTISPECIES: hypothetical protein [unclassified Pseudofrankia]|uniref:hypothetical protein n=1 Tax=unclassified Pseudofrankia TaxID=2994372 RepID=UPI0008DABD6C|nr:MULTISPECIES: hypothetical protein [unclassified Pseudofrankia]MDT3441816.1 hypothetical protein [Pseudofrankia sp. BMG5.37]OHV47101.1 hypothetical protein BCD48_20405 [Pseudofrankia sp. BMG5.36]